MKRREAVTVIGVTGAAVLAGCAPTATQTATPQSAGATQGPVAAPGVKVGTLEDFKTVGAFKEVSVGSSPALVSRVASPQQGGLSVGDVHLVALSRVCTHLGCLVGSPKNGAVDCGCHGSEFDAATGAVKKGPASQPLKAFKLETRADGIYALTV